MPESPWVAGRACSEVHAGDPRRPLTVHSLVRIEPIVAAVLLAVSGGLAQEERETRVLTVTYAEEGVANSDEPPRVCLVHMNHEDAAALVTTLLAVEWQDALRNKYAYHLIVPDPECERIVRAALAVWDHPLVSWKAHDAAADPDDAVAAMRRCAWLYLRGDHPACLDLARKAWSAYKWAELESPSR